MAGRRQFSGLSAAQIDGLGQSVAAEVRRPWGPAAVGSVTLTNPAGEMAIDVAGEGRLRILHVTGAPSGQWHLWVHADGEIVRSSRVPVSDPLDVYVPAVSSNWSWGWLHSPEWYGWRRASVDHCYDYIAIAFRQRLQVEVTYPGPITLIYYIEGAVAS